MNLLDQMHYIIRLYVQCSVCITHLLLPWGFLHWPDSHRIQSVNYREKNNSWLVWNMHKYIVFSWIICSSILSVRIVIDLIFSTEANLFSCLKPHAIFSHLCHQGKLILLIIADQVVYCLKHTYTARKNYSRLFAFMKYNAQKHKNLNVSFN